MVSKPGSYAGAKVYKAFDFWAKEKKLVIQQIQQGPLEKLIQEVLSYFDLRKESIYSSSRRREITEARAIISCLAFKDMGYSTTEVGRALAISRVNAGRCAECGKRILDRYNDVKEIVQ